MGLSDLFVLKEYICRNNVNHQTNLIMKTIFLWIAFLAMTTVHAQTELEFPMNEEGTEARWEGIIEVTGTTKDELYDRGLAWINKFYTNPVGVIKSQNKATGEIEGKAKFKLNTKDKKGIVSPNGAFVEYSFKLMFKDNKFKYEITRVHAVAQSYYDVSKWLDTKQANYHEATFNYNIEQTLEYLDKWQDELTSSLKKKPDVKKSDW